MKRMKHPNPPQWTHVYTPAEEEALRKLGWVDDDAPPEEPKKKPKPKVDA